MIPNRNRANAQPGFLVKGCRWHLFATSVFGDWVHNSWTWANTTWTNDAPPLLTASVRFWGATGHRSPATGLLLSVCTSAWNSLRSRSNSLVSWTWPKAMAREAESHIWRIRKDGRMLASFLFLVSTSNACMWHGKAPERTKVRQAFLPQNIHRNCVGEFPNIRVSPSLPKVSWTLRPDTAACSTFSARSQSHIRTNERWLSGDGFWKYRRYKAETIDMRPRANPKNTRSQILPLLLWTRQLHKCW